MNSRNHSLDALRGFAILTMVLSGTIAFGDVLPAWMFHAQVPPPQHKFDPTIPGITWVDLVFPFFLFSMGAAIPLSLKKYFDERRSGMLVCWIALKRFLLLAFSALFTHHMKAWAISDAPGISEHLLSLVAFLLLFFQFYDGRRSKHHGFWLTMRVASFVSAVYLLWQLPFWNGKGFDWYKSDIIILVLANMALFGTLAYYFTANQPLLRIGILPFVMAIFFVAKEPNGGLVKDFFHFSSIGSFNFDWLYKFYFLKYLFIIIPGTIAGEWMMLHQPKADGLSTNKSGENLVAAVAVLMVIVNLYGLFTRLLLLNFFTSFVLCFTAFYVVKQNDGLIKKLVVAGSYLLLLGLIIEAFEGGIKKDPSTYSYYFVTSGLAFYCLVSFSVLFHRKFFVPLVNFFSLNGKNPMVAYVAGNLLLLPLMQLTSLKIYWDGMNHNPLIGFMKGILFTGVVSLVTIFFVKRKWFWKT